MLSGGRSVLSLKGNEERKLITSHFSSLYHTFLPFITLSLFFLFVSLHPQALIYSLLASFTHPLPSILSLSNLFPATSYDSPSVCLHVSFQSINGAYMLHDTVHLDVSPAPAVSLGYHSGFMLFHSALLYGGNSNTEVNAEREWEKRVRQRE